jgi:hypothetical protein
MRERMILNYRAVGEEAVMHSQVANPILTEETTIFFVECAECGPIGLFSDTAVVDAMLDHAKAGV